MTQSKDAETVLVPAMMIYDACVDHVNRLVDACHRFSLQHKEAIRTAKIGDSDIEVGDPYGKNIGALTLNARNLRNFLSQTDTQALISLFRHNNGLMPENFFDRLLGLLEEAALVLDPESLGTQTNRPDPDPRSLRVKSAIIDLAENVLRIAATRDDLETPEYVIPRPTFEEKRSIQDFADTLFPEGIVTKVSSQTSRRTVVLVDNIRSLSIVSANLRKQRNWTWKCVDLENDKWTKVGRKDNIRNSWKRASVHCQMIFDLSKDTDQFARILEEIKSQCLNRDRIEGNTMTDSLNDAQAELVLATIRNLVDRTIDFFKEGMPKDAEFQEDTFDRFCLDFLAFTDEFNTSISQTLNIFREAGFTPKLFDRIRPAARPIEDVMRSL